MLDVTKTLTLYGKRIAKFKKLNRIAALIQAGEASVRAVKGRYGGGSFISENLYKEFMLWVSEDTRKTILDKTS